MEFLAEYASFLAKTATLVIAILIVLSAIAGLRGKGRRKSGGQLQVTRLNEFYKDLRERLESGLLDKAQLKAAYKEQLRKPRDADAVSGAGLGLIDIARKASEPLQASLRELSDGRAFISLRAVM